MGRRRAGDTDGDGMPDAWEMLNDLDPRLDDAVADLDSDGIPNREDARPNEQSVGRLTITITTPGNGAVVQ